MNIKEIQEIIPHRYPFLLVDFVEYVIPGEKVVAYKNVSINEQHFIGHFPEEPVMPGVLIIESLAQAGAIAILSLEENKGKIPYFAGINKARFRRKVVPGDRLKLEVDIIKMKGNIGVGKAIAKVEEEIACEVELMFALGS
ncbi:3-hydroxyacyl-ACP dehydratase FabZ [Clostridium sp. MSJ-4]|uniref:3-hydroxyacyl-[acyl-carrier-protein] dehydratase FabZ n=1 Tax=Clostridium simiarum TaxID=2841506 RepID=A0ABS6EXU6_9CLOT|nr:MULTISPECIES: 3-hydroxyacyl-ACP dehydratase FabZ [Clostridium]MBU5590950.1 3-hydroxyacyl-ACP dehydratase FabZ [Clostridium simiarum]